MTSAHTDQLQVALGAMTFGTRQDEATSFALLDQFVDAGGSWIDTANCYAFWESPDGRGGASETMLGRWFAARPGARDRVQISTKVGCEPAGPGTYPEATEGLAAATVERALEESLTRLGTDHVELYWAHRDDRGTPLEETVGAFAAQVDAGRVGRVGLSNYALWRVERARGIAAQHGWVTPSALQLRHSYLQPRPLVRDAVHDHRFGWVTDEVLDYATTEPGWELWAYSPLLSGAYDRDDRPLPQAYDHPGTTRRLAALTTLAGDLGVSRSAVVVAWMLASTPPVRPILGVSTPAQLADAVAGARLRLTPEQVAALDEPW